MGEKLPMVLKNSTGNEFHIKSLFCFEKGISSLFKGHIQGHWFQGRWFPGHLMTLQIFFDTSDVSNFQISSVEFSNYPDNRYSKEKEGLSIKNRLQKNPVQAQYAFQLRSLVKNS